MVKKPRMTPIKPVTEDELIRRLHNELGTEVAISMRPVPPVSVSLQRQASAALLSMDRDAITYAWATNEPRLNVIWASVPTDNHYRLMLRRLVAACGIWENDTNHLWLVPHEMTKTPTPDEVARYLPWTMKALEATGARTTILLGSRSVWLWRPDMKPVNVNGKLFVWRDRWMVYPLLHPQNVDKRAANEWDRQLSRLGQIVRDDNILWWLESGCMKCNQPLYMYDPDGVPWCQEHIKEGLKLQREGSEKWATLSIHAISTQLFPSGGC